VTDTISESENPGIESPTPDSSRPRTNRDWWPNQPDLTVLHHNSPQPTPLGPDFDYREEFSKLDL
jgi:catalase-peroxidase